MRYGKDVQLEIQRIFDRNKEVRASVVLKRAANPKSALHEHFEWDDTKAAHQFRLIQTRRMIREVPVMVNGVLNELIHVPIQISVPHESREGCYIPLSLVTEERDAFLRALAEAREDMLAGKRRFNTLLKQAKDEKEQNAMAVIMSAFDTIDATIKEVLN